MSEMTTRDLAERLGISPESVRARAHKLGLTPERGKFGQYLYTPQQARRLLGYDPRDGRREPVPAVCDNYCPLACRRPKPHRVGTGFVRVPVCEECYRLDQSDAPPPAAYREYERRKAALPPMAPDLYERACRDLAAALGL